MNKDLILREKLALERTVMANQRTFLSFLRTSLYFLIGGLSLGEIIQVKYETVIAVSFFVISFLLFLIGLISFYKQKKNIRESRKQIGGSVLDYEEDI